MTGFWIEIAVGAWVLVSPWLLGFEGITVMKWSNVLAGLLVILVGVWRIFGRYPDEPVVKESQSNQTNS